MEHEESHPILRRFLARASAKHANDRSPVVAIELSVDVQCRRVDGMSALRTSPSPVLR